MTENTEAKEAQTVYELCYLVLPSIAEEDLSKVVDSLKAIVTKAGGAEIDGEEPIKQDLAYTMTKTVGASRYVVNEAYVGWIKFESVSDKVNDIKSAVEKMDEVLRFLIVKAPRETTFTFAEAIKAMEAKNAPEVEEEVVAGPAEEPVVE